MKIVIITDAWEPQVNGVVRTYQNIISELKKNNHDITVINPNDFKTYPCPGYNEISLSLFPYKKLKSMVDVIQPDAIHIAVEGPLGMAGRKYCKRHNIPFTTSFHTHFPDYLKKRVPSFLQNITYKTAVATMRWFHKPAHSIFVATPSLEQTLKSWGFKNNMVRLVRGIDTDIFYPPKRKKAKTRPSLLYVGRVSIEKNLEAFLSIDIDADKIIVGDGPARKELEAKYPNAQFKGILTGTDLADEYRNADCFVFPSKSDTFGIVLIEAMACGLPIAAYPVTGPIDIITEPFLGTVDDSLHNAITHALSIKGPKAKRFDHAINHYSWAQVADTFLDTLSTKEQPTIEQTPSTNKIRTIFLSDFHMGYKGFDAPSLIDFLDHHDCDIIYLLGDIIDGWKMEKRWYWNKDYTRLIDLLVQKKKDGCKIFYCPGNHDEKIRDILNLPLRLYLSHKFKFKIADQFTHIANDGKTYLCLHGDQFDGRLVRKSSRMADIVYQWFVERGLASPHSEETIEDGWRKKWSLGKTIAKNGTHILKRLNSIILNKVITDDVDGLIYGHSHVAGIQITQGKIIANCGSWTLSTDRAPNQCNTAIVEYQDGTIGQVFHPIMRSDKALPSQPIHKIKTHHPAAKSIIRFIHNLWRE